MQILIDTGATNTFINYKTLHSIKQATRINKHSSSFVLADGIAPFHVLGVVELQILFSNQITNISAHVAQDLCTDVILGMDYITLYNLKFNLRKRIISIDLNNRLYQMNINQNVQTEFIPVTLLDPLCIPAQSDRSAKVSIPISSICSQFIPHYPFSLCNTAFVSHKFLQFCNHLTHVTFSNTSHRSHVVPQGTRIGYLCHYSITQSNTNSANHFHKSCGVTNEFGELPDFHASATNTNTDNHTQDRLYCATIDKIHPSTERDIYQLISKINIKQHRDDLLKLLFRFHKIFDTTKHNTANTPIHHVINTVPHSPPACKPYPQPDTVEIMYNMIQEYLKAELVTESHSPYAAPAFLVKKHDGTYRFVVDYKKLNLITIKDSSPLPNMEDTIRKLGEGYRYFSKLDLKSGFYQIPIREADKEKTAFTTPFGLYQFNVLPMGLKNSPPTFQKAQAFKQLKQMLTSTPLFLHYPIPDKPLILTTDASGIGIGGVLQQEVDGHLHNLYYHSQLLTSCERKYSTIEKEALAIYKCFVRMRPLLLGRQITIMTDHCPLCHIMTKTVNNVRVDRIATLIQEYNIDKVVHINGHRNCLPDYLSRYPHEPNDDLFDIEYGLNNNITQYNNLLFDLSITLNFTVVDFHVMDYHIGVDRMHLDFKYSTLVQNSIVDYFQYLTSIVIVLPVKPMGRSREAKARRNKRRHIKLFLKQQQYFLTRPIESSWSLKSIKIYLHDQKIKFAKIPSVYRKTLRIQFNNSVDLQIAEATLPQDAFFQ
ncbi:unnamed protein product [Rotaria sordida]|uniref:RNA-directed DNA polymerase n=2 Tax=Rotaria sordida TaxID=392033 RepID=A0A819DKH1_9BILA|nr:unnamed protein product [Rotaria sordida]